METKLFDYILDEKRIAKLPLEKRDESRLLVCRSNGRLGDFTSEFSFSHHQFKDISEYLGPGDLLVMNNAKVLPVRLLGEREGTGGAVEALILKRLGTDEASAILKLGAKIQKGIRFLFNPGLIAEVMSTHEERVANNGEVILKFSGMKYEKVGLEKWLEQHGHVPLPPYIDRQDNETDKKVYQTVYAEKTGSAAAPTAGFHFTVELLDRLRARGVEISTVTLHVGIGTFRPIKAEKIEEHEMHTETFEITEEFRAKFLEAKKNGKRIVAVGTTVVRSLESWLTQDAEAKAGVYQTAAYIRPGYRFLAVDDLITNFHLPRSTLLVMIAAAMGLEAQRKAYEIALKEEYRFFSYGDAMFIRGK